ncbi:MAG: glycosyltransferase 87 family protein [Caldilineales bacterium]|nr:glycosyltransferase 87 family protein [Caldilineales bacterium]MCW5857434.1 DUF2029 domain-containing protein [Caldilineales bacterium]
MKRLAGRGWAALAGLGLVSLAIYAWLGWRYPLAEFLRWSRAGWFPPQEADLGSLLPHLAAYLGLFAAYALALRLSQPGRTPDAGRSKVGVVLVVWLLASLLMLRVTPGGDSHDVFDYLYRGRMLVEQGASPLTTTPNDLPRQPFYYYTAWKKHVDTYGPAWEYASGGVAGVVGRGLERFELSPAQHVSCPASTASCRALMAYVSGYRLLAILLALISGGLIAAIVRRDDSRLILPALVAWFWNPLVISSTALGAHNDALLLALLLAAFGCYQRRWWLAGLLLLALSAHVKLTALIWAPAMVFWLWRQVGLRRTVFLSLAALLITLPLSWLLYWPLGGWASLPRMLHERLLFVANSPWQLLHYYLYKVREWPLDTVRLYSTRLPSYLFAVAGLAVSAWLVWRRGGAKSERRLWGAATAVALLYLLVGSFWFQHWYMVWAAAPAALLPDHPFTRRILPWLCFGAMCSNIVYDAFARLPAPALTPPQLQALVVALVWAPAGVAFLRVRSSRCDAL